VLLENFGPGVYGTGSASGWSVVARDQTAHDLRWARVMAQRPDADHLAMDLTIPGPSRG